MSSQTQDLKFLRDDLRVSMKKIIRKYHADVLKEKKMKAVEKVLEALGANEVVLWLAGKGEAEATVIILSNIFPDIFAELRDAFSYFSNNLYVLNLFLKVTTEKVQMVGRDSEPLKKKLEEIKGAEYCGRKIEDDDEGRYYYDYILLKKVNVDGIDVYIYLIVLTKNEK